MKKIVYAILLTVLALVLIISIQPATAAELNFDSNWVWVPAVGDITVPHGLDDVPYNVVVVVKMDGADSANIDGAFLPWMPIYETTTLHLYVVTHDNIVVRNTGRTPMLIRIFASAYP